MNDIRNRLPLLLMLAGVVIFTLFATLKIQHWEGLMWWTGTLACGGYLLWLIAESDVALTESGKGATRKDGNTCELYVFGRFLTVFTALAGSTWWETPNSFMGLGMLVFAGGILFRLRAIQTLGQFYSHRVRLLSDHQVVNSGPYRWVRHPAYTGMLLAHLGFVLVFFNIYALVALICVLLPAMVQRIRIEEVALHELDGYSDYAFTHKRLIPGVW